MCKVAALRLLLGQGRGTDGYAPPELRRARSTEMSDRCDSWGLAMVRRVSVEPVVAHAALRHDLLLAVASGWNYAELTDGSRSTGTRRTPSAPHPIGSESPRRHSCSGHLEFGTRS